MDMEEKIQQYCGTCSDDKCLDCQLHQFLEFRRAGQSSQTKPTLDFRSEDGMASLLSTSLPGSISHSTSLDGRSGSVCRTSALSPLEKNIYEAYLKTSTANLIESVEVTGRKAVIVFAPSAAIDPFEIAISASVRTLASFAALTEVEIRVGKRVFKTSARRVEQLIGKDAVLKIGQDWSVLWSYLRPLKQYPEVKEKVIQFLQGNENDAPVLIKSILAN